MNPHFTSMVVFATITLGILAVAGLFYDLCLRNKSRISERMKSEFRDHARERAQTSPLFRDLRKLDGDSAEDRIPTEVRWQTYVSQAGLMWTLPQFALGCVLSGFVFGACVWMASKISLLAAVGVIVGTVGPFVYIAVTRRGRMAKLCQQLPEAFEIMGRALRAGQTVPAAFQIVANDFPLPIKEEFAHCYEQQHLGIPFEAALRDLARRTGFVETQIFAVALIVNRQVGGNLAEMLEKLAVTMRKRARFQGRVRALTGEGRMQAMVLIALPLLSFLALQVLDPSYAETLLDRPALIAGMIVSQLIGTVCILKIINFPY